MSALRSVLRKGIEIEKFDANRILALIKEAANLPGAELDTPERLAMFIAQCHHESIGFTRLEENGNYSARRLTQVWPKRFPPGIAKEYAHDPERILSRAYANRMGNRDEESMDGWVYRGRGLLQLTGSFNYYACGAALDKPYKDSPGLVSEPEHAVRTAVWFWKTKGCAQKVPDVRAVTKIINGGYNGLEDRERLYAKLVPGAYQVILTSGRHGSG